MNPFELEELIQNYYKSRQKGYSPSTLLFKLLEFTDLLLRQDNESVREAYFGEIRGELEHLLDLYSPFGIESSKTKQLLKQINYVSRLAVGIDLNDKAIRIREELDQQIATLNGEKISNIINSLSFPVLHRDNDQDIIFGAIEYFKISISTQKHITKTEFFIMPSLPEIEQKLEIQIKNSWICATNYLRTKYSKKIPNFEVTLSFVRKMGIYEGNSLGIVLTIELIKALGRYFELRDSIYFDKNMMATGSTSSEGVIDPVGDSIIVSKVNIAFYSLSDIFIIPFADLNAAKNELKKLKSLHPNRNLKLLPVIDINDIINRRDIVGIKRQNIIKWGGSKLIKNKAVISLFVLFTVISISFFYLNSDKNPSKLELVDGRYLVKNKQDKVLWYKGTGLGENYSNNKSALWNKYRFYDVDNDGLNEVLMVHLNNSPSLYLFDDDGEQIWSFLHYDSLATKNEIFTGHFSSYGIIDTIHSSSSIEILVYVQHNTYYPTGILKLDLKTGKQVGDILWHPGSITGAILNDWNKDGKKEIIACGPANGMHRAYLFSIDSDKLKGTFPTADNYKFLKMELAEFNKYILFPKTDYAELFFNKYNAPMEAPSILNKDVISISIGEGSATSIDADFSYQVRLDRNLDPINCVIGDSNILIRDKLISEGELNPPSTGSKEFLDSILQNIEYWNGEKFVKY